jgi:putative DNA base modification enzyme with NMAD domain
MQVWTYVISSDDGSAPNYEPPFVTLSICKPRIRRKARPGQMILAFNGWRLHPEPNSVRWAGIVREVIPLGGYWEDGRFRNKRPDRSKVPDNIYRPSRGGLEQVKNPIHSAWNARTDIGGINALVFDDWWYFRGTAPIVPQEFGLWMTGGRRHEPCHELDAKEWDALIAWLEATKLSLGEIDIPRGGDDSRGGCGPSRAPKRPPC